MILYHGTTFNNLLGITKSNMIIPQSGLGAGAGLPNYREHMFGRVFFTDSLHLALDYSVYVLVGIKLDIQKHS